MARWLVKLDFTRDDDPTQAEWDRMVELLGPVEGHSGSGPPRDLSSSYPVEAPDEETAQAQLLDQVRQRLADSSLEKWTVTVDMSWPDPAIEP